jgi:hypothetical protein
MEETANHTLLCTGSGACLAHVQLGALARKLEGADRHEWEGRFRGPVAQTTLADFPNVLP